MSITAPSSCNHLVVYGQCLLCGKKFDSPTDASLSPEGLKPPNKIWEK